MGSHQSSCFQPTNHQPIIIEILKPNIRPRVVVSEMILNDYPNFCSTLSYVYHLNILEHTTEQTPQNSNICYTITYIRVTTTFSVIFLVFMKSPNSSKYKSHIISNFIFFLYLTRFTASHYPHCICILKLSCNKCNTTCATCGAGTPFFSGPPVFTPVFQGRIQDFKLGGGGAPGAHPPPLDPTLPLVSSNFLLGFVLLILSFSV